MDVRCFLGDWNLRCGLERFQEIRAECLGSTVDDPSHQFSHGRVGIILQKEMGDTLLVLTLPVREIPSVVCAFPRGRRALTRGTRHVEMETAKHRSTQVTLAEDPRDEIVGSTRRRDACEHGVFHLDERDDDIIEELLLDERNFIHENEITTRPTTRVLCAKRGSVSNGKRNLCGCVCGQSKTSTR